MQSQTIEGNWEGTLEAPGVKLKIVFHITTDGKTYRATMDSPDQGAMGIPVTETNFTDEKLSLKIANLGASYEGQLDPSSEAIKGVFKQGPAVIPLNLTKVEGETSKPNRSQVPQPPFPYQEEMVQYENTQAEGVTLAGTLTLPKGEGPHPVVILISGSGPQNRDEELLGHKPFLVIADHLTRQGIAVLRYDDRGVAKSTGDFSKATSADFATDVEAGIAYLKTRDDIDKKKIGLIGHSEGGLIAPMVAAKSKDVAFIVLMAGPGVTGKEILLLQQDLIAKANGVDPDILAISRKINQKTYDLIEEHGDQVQVIKSELMAYAEQEMSRLSVENQEALKQNLASLDQSLQIVTSPWFRYFLSYDPAVALQKTKCPVLAINGEKDLQVDADQNLPAIEAALKKGGNKHYSIKRLSNHNHLFQTSTSGNPTEYAQITETVSPTALKAMTDWLQTQIK